MDQDHGKRVGDHSHGPIVRRKARASPPVPIILVLLCALSSLFTPVVALDESLPLSHATTTQRGGYRVPIGFSFTLLILIGHYAIAFSGTLVGPLMGITSVLWLMMRNDAAIDPKASWM